MVSGTPVGRLIVKIGADTAELVSGLQEGMRATDQWAGGLRNKLQATSKQLQDMGRTASLRLTAPIAGFGAMALHTAGQFEESMNRVRAVSGATGDQFDALKVQAQELGRTTRFTASEAADAMGFLAMAGFEANEILGAMPGTLELAASAQMDLASAADLVSNVLTGYGKNVEELAHVNDVLVKAFTSANTDLRQLGEAMKFVGPIASAAGANFEEVTAAIGLLGNAGIQGSMAGTSLRNALGDLVRMAPPVKKAFEQLGVDVDTSNGQIGSLIDVIRDLEPHANNAGFFLSAFGKRAGPAMAALVGQGADALEALTKELQESGGTAAAIADVQMQGLNGAMAELRSAFEGLQIAIAESGLLEFVTDLTKRLTGFLQGLAETNPEMLKMATVIGGLVAAIGPLLIGLSMVAAGLAALLSPIGLVVVAVAGLTAAWVAWGDDIKAAVGGALDWLTAKFETFTEGISAVTTRIRDAWSWLSDTLVGNSIIPDMWDAIEERFERGGDAIAASTARMTTDVSRNYARMASSVIGDLQRLTSGIGRENKAAFRLNKMAAIAQAIVSTHQGVAKTLSTYPWPLAGVLAGIHAAAGMAQVAAIRSASMGGGGGGGAAVGASGAAAAGTTAAPAAAAPQQTTLIRLEGQTFGAKQVRDLIERINEELGAGARLRIA